MFIDETILNQLKVSKEHYLTSDEVWKLIVHKELFKKFLLQTAFSIWIEIGNWVHRWNDEVMHQVKDKLVQMTSIIEKLELEYDKYQEKLENS